MRVGKLLAIVSGPFLAATLFMGGCNGHPSILNGDGESSQGVPADAPICPVCGKPEPRIKNKHNNGHHYGQHKHQPPKANG